MTRKFAKVVFDCLADALRANGWSVTIDTMAVEIEGRRAVDASMENIVSFASIYNKSDAICFQIGLGVRFHDVNRVISQLRGSDASRQLTAYVLLNHMAPQRAKRSGWCLVPGAVDDVTGTAKLMVQDVLSIPEVGAMFSSIVDVRSYIDAIEQARWPFMSVHEPYIAALIVDGRIEDAKLAAERVENEYRATIAQRGLEPREEDLKLVRAVQKMLH